MATLFAGMIEPMSEKTDMRETHARRDIPQAPLLAAARGDKPSRRPVWFMRQAGRSLPEYRALRANVGMLEACFTPEVAAEITLQPVRRHDVDAAIFFSDIVVPLKAAGIEIDIIAGRGPVVDKPVRSRADVAALPELHEEQLAAIGEAIGQTLSGLSDTQALIGFAGAPFTVASYLVEGGPSRTLVKTKTMMHADPEAWHALMTTLTQYVMTFLKVQIDAGIDAMQLFDSWAGYLCARDYRRFVAPYSAQIFQGVREISTAHGQASIPRIHFGVTTGELLGDMALTGPDVMGVDFRVDMTSAAERISRAVRHAEPGDVSGGGVAGGIAGGGPLVLQGNLDPALLCAGRGVVDTELESLIAETDALISSGTVAGHIVNLGHGVLPETEPDIITHAVEKVHSL